MELTLLGYFRSSSTWRVRIALAHKALKWTSLPVHLLRDGGQQHTESHRALNPMEQVPVLLVDGEPVAQSVAILEYLEEIAPTPALLPRDPLARARVRQMVEVVNSGIQPLQNLRTMQRLGTLCGADKAAQQAWSLGWIEEGFAALETLVMRAAGTCSQGDTVSLADVMLVPQMFNARRFHVDLAPYPTLQRVEQHLLTLPAFRDTRPEAQPDAEA